MKRKILRISMALVLLLSFSMVTAVPAMANVGITTADADVDADTYVTGLYTALPAIVIAESAAGEIATVTIVLDVPSGFEFRTSINPDVAVTGAGGLIATFTSITTTQLTINVGTASSSSADTLTIGGVSAIWVRPTTGTLTTDDITMTSGTIAGVTGSTSFGTLTMVAGAVTKLAFTTQPAGSVSGSALITQPVVKAQDQFGNTATAYVTDVVASEDDAGALTGTLTVTPILGVATFTDLVYTATADDETFQIDVTSGALTPATSTNVVSKLGVTVTPASGGTAISSDDHGGSYTTLGSIVITEGASGDIPITTYVLTIPTGFEFETTPAPDVVATGSGELVVTSPVTMATSTITFSVTTASSGDTNVLTIGGSVPIKVRPTAGGTPLVTNDILMTSGTIEGVTATTNFGTLTMVVGTVTQLVFTTQPTASISGSPITPQPVVEAQDAQGNTDAAYVTPIVASTDEAGTLTGTLTAIPLAGVATFTNLVYTTTTNAEAFDIDVTDGTLFATSSAVTSYIEVTLTTASGGTAISADTYATGAYTELGPIIITEAAFGTIGTGNIVLDAPSGFEFRITLNPDVVVTGTTPQLAVTFIGITTTQLTVNVGTASTSEVDNVLTIGGTSAIGVRPTAGNPLATGNILMTTGTIQGLSASTNFGTLTMVVGAVTQLAFNPQPSGSVSGFALTTQPVVEAQDQFGNTDAAYVTPIVASENDAGTLAGTLTAIPLAGVATFTNLVYTAAVDGELFQIDVTSGALSATSDGVNSDVVATKILVTTAPASIDNTVSMTQPVVAYVDAQNTVDTGIGADTITITEDGTGTLGGSTTVTASSGVVTFSGLVYTATAGGEAVTFTFTDDTGGAKDFSLAAVVSVVTVYDVVLTLPEGWTLFSTANWINTTDSAWIDTYVQFLKYTPTGFLSANLTDNLKPVEALYAQMGSGGGDLGIIYSTVLQGISTKALVAGWNLVSSATADDADEVFSPLRYALIGGQQGVGLTTVVAQGSYNVNTTNFYLPALTEAHWTSLSVSLDPFDGYWVHMNAATSFSVVPD